MAKILIVEDDRIIARMYSIKFLGDGFEVQLAENGQQGLELMKTFNPDMVLMDLMMPVMDGFSALEIAKADTGLKDIPIIVLTNLSMIEDVEKVKRMGALDYIVKSNMTPKEVLEKVKGYLKN